MKLNITFAQLDHGSHVIGEMNLSADVGEGAAGATVEIECDGVTAGLVTAVQPARRLGRNVRNDGVDAAERDLVESLLGAFG